MGVAGEISFNSDWEGPWVTADHAYEVIAKGIPDGAKIFSNSSQYVISQLRGDELFKRISQYDDYEYYVENREGYEPGDTLALVGPFIPAFGLDSKFVERVAQDNANFIDGALPTLNLMKYLGWRPKIISTSYEQYVHHTAGKIAGIPATDLYCTKFPIDDYIAEITEKDKKLVREMAVEIAKLPEINITDSTKAEDITENDMVTIEYLDRFYWELLPKTTFARLVEEIKPIGGTRKYNALLESLKSDGCSVSESVTVGDSITDIVMLEKTRDGGGLAVSFNGNGYAVRKANVAVMSSNCITTAVLADIFARGGLPAVEAAAKSWDPHMLHDLAERGDFEPELYRAFSEAFSGPDAELPVVRWLDEDNLESTIEESKTWRKRVRGKKIGSLG